MNTLAQFGKRYSNWITGFLILYFVFFVASTSVTQDDYATLSDLSLDGFWGPTNGVWNVLGGNISSVFPRTLALGFGFKSSLPLGLVIYSAVTLLLVTVSIDYLLGLFVPRLKSVSLSKRLPLILILSLGFEGLFTPGELGVLGFSAAAGVHVWPICFIILGHKFFSYKSFPAFLCTALMFLYSSNSNVPEGALAVLVVTILNYRSLLLNGRLLVNGRSVKNVVLLLASISVLFVIFLAPGFQARTETAGVSLEPKDLAIGVMRAVMFFSADILTHPFLYLVAILGYIVGKSSSLEAVRKPIQEFGFLALAYFLLLVAGAGAAYPAWHQTFGLYVFLLPLAFSLGLLYSNKIWKIRILGSALLIPIIVICSLVTVRSGYTVVNRKLTWQSNFEHNVCLVKSGMFEGFRGSEITYPPKKLGVEDLNTWPWMADGFRNWVVARNFQCRVNVASDQ